MSALILGGNSPRHREWIREVARHLEPVVDEAYPHDYQSWQHGGETDVAYEIEAAAQMVEHLDEYIIVAKSIGTIIAVNGIANGAFKARKCLLLGMPLSIAAENFPDLGLSLERVPRASFMQNQFDPYGSATDLTDYVTSHQPRKYVIEVNPDDHSHDYLDFQQIVAAFEALKTD